MELLNLKATGSMAKLELSLSPCLDCTYIRLPVGLGLPRTTAAVQPAIHPAMRQSVVTRVSVCLEETRYTNDRAREIYPLPSLLPVHDHATPCIDRSIPTSQFRRGRRTSSSSSGCSLSIRC